MDLLITFEPVPRLLAEGFAVRSFQVQGTWFYFVRSGLRALSVVEELGFEGFAFKGVKSSNLVRRTSYVLVFREGKLLLLQRDIGKLIWEMPGGGNEPNEGPREAAKRELFEETGLVAENLLYLGSYYWKNKYEHFYLATEVKGEVKISKEHLGFSWFKSSELPENLALSFLHMLEVMAGKAFVWRNEEACKIAKDLLGKFSF